MNTNEETMINKLSFFFFFVAIITGWFQSAQAGIVDSNDIIVVQDKVDPKSIVLFNITGTLYQPATTLADNQWRTYFAERVNQLVANSDAAQKLIDKIKNEIVENIPKAPVEEITPDIIAKLQALHIPVFGISQKRVVTTYADNFGHITSRHLKSIGIDLEKTLDYCNVTATPDNSGYTFAYGIIFSNKKPVGPAILNFLMRLENRPAKIVMVDNSQASLESAETALASTGIHFEGIRYGHDDARQDNFDAILGIIQFFAFKNEGKILSDADALEIKKCSKVKYEAMLDNFIINSVKEAGNEGKGEFLSGQQ